MKLKKNTIITAVIICYLAIGFIFWSSSRAMGAPFFEGIATFLFVTLLWALLVGMLLFGVLAIPAIIVLLLALLLTIKRKYAIAASLFLTIAILLSSLFLPISIAKQEELATVTMGLPTPFFVQDQSQYEPPLPSRTRVFSAHENPTNILWPQFMESFFIVFVTIFCLLYVLGTISRQRKKQRLSETHSDSSGLG